MDSFESARRYLANQAKCVIFCGPVLDDENQIHPLVEAVDLAALVRVGEHFDPRFLDPFEEKLSALDGREAWSVRLDKSISVDDEAPGLETREDARKAQPTLVAEVEDLVERAGLADGGDGKSKAPPASAAAPKEKAEASREKAAETKAAREKADQEKASMKAAAPPHRPEQPPGSPSAERAARTADRGPQPARRLGGSKVFRIATISVAVMLVVFVFWWLYLTKPVRERHQAPVGPAEEVAQTQTAADTARAEPEPPASVETPPAKTPPETQTVETVEEPELTDDGAGAIPKPTDVVVSETLDPYANQYLIHVSSFRALENAKDEAFYLLGWGYPVFIYRADLGNKGMWYRVYVGPSETRAEAREYKIKLDENRRIKSTRIARVPG
jgi:cell division protein FtsN